jgi:hypothetical protein
MLTIVISLEIFMLVIVACLYLPETQPTISADPETEKQRVPVASRSEELAANGSVIGVKFTGSVDAESLSELAAIPTLRRLDLRDTRIGNAQLLFIRQLNLEWLDLAGTTISPIGFRNLATQNKLKYLVPQNN